MKITKDLCKTLDADIRTALAAIAEKHGLVLKLNGGSFSETAFTPRVEFGVAGEVGPSKKDEDSFKTLADLYGLEPGDLGKTFTSGGTLFRIVGLLPGRSKNVVSLTRISDSRSMKAPVDFVKAGLGRA